MTAGRLCVRLYDMEVLINQGDSVKNAYSIENKR